MHKMEASPAWCLTKLRKPTQQPRLNNVNDVVLQLVLILIKRRWVGLETLSLSDVQGNYRRLVAITKRILHSQANELNKGPHTQGH